MSLADVFGKKNVIDFIISVCKFDYIICDCIFNSIIFDCIFALTKIKLFMTLGQIFNFYSY